ncbi:MAG: hypothetical protein NTV46_18565, partial [Verrucomicrobia bacterium]|nr:hypothetical protein [Verrucomicrobiota bacterium]
MLATPYPQQPGAIVIKLNKAGTDKMIAWTKDMASQKDRIAMVLDGVVINAPVVYKVPLRDNFIIEELCEPGEVNCLIAALMNPYEMPVVIDDKKTAIMNKLRSIVIPRIDLEDVSLEEAVHFFRLRAAELDIKELDPTLKGINIVIRQTRPGVDGKGGHEFGRINLKLENIPLAKAFAAVAEHTGAVFTVDDFAV